MHPNRDQNGSHHDNTGSHPDMFPPGSSASSSPASPSNSPSGSSSSSHPASQPTGDPIIAQFQPPLLSDDELATPFESSSEPSQMREYWNQHWQIISGLALIIILLLTALVLVLWKPEKPNRQQPPAKRSAIERTQPPTSAHGTLHPQT